MTRHAAPAIRLLSRGEVMRLLDLDACIDAIEGGFRLAADDEGVRSAVLGLGASDGGFHVKAAVMRERPGRTSGYFAAKMNANFPSNPARHGLPTIQGVLTLFDSTTGVPLAVMDSIAITILRTAAATAVAARWLALPDASTLTIVGCGAQALAQVQALCLVRSIERVFAVDIDSGTADAFATTATKRLGIPVAAVSDLPRATLASEIIVTCTPSRRAFLGREHVSPGTFVAAVGADNEHKQEIEPALLAASCVITDSTSQCVAIGDLHHAIAANAMRVDDVRSELGPVVVDPAKGRRNATEIVIYDSTGVAFQDLVAASLVYERAEERRVGTSFALADDSVGAQKSGLSFREARRGDEAGVRQVVGSVLEEFGFPADPGGLDRDLVDISASYLEAGGTFMVLVTPGERIVGCGGLYPLWPGTLELRKMYFLPEARGQGLGKTLMEMLIGFARRGGFERIYLQTASRLAAAAHLYRSAGFEDTEPIHPHIPGRSDRAMALILRKQ